MEHFKATLTYNARIDGEVKTLKENYLHYGVSYTDVEAQIAEVYKSRMKRHDTTNIGKIKFTKIFHFPIQVSDKFWAVTVKVHGVDKSWKESYLLAAKDDQEAGNRVRMELRGFQVPFEVTLVKVTDIMGYWVPLNPIWEMDWKDRMERAYDAGYYEDSVENNQMDIPFEPAKSMQDIADEMGAEITISGTDQKGKRKKKTFKPGITFFNKQGDPIK